MSELTAERVILISAENIVYVGVGGDGLADVVGVVEEDEAAVDGVESGEGDGRAFEDDAMFACGFEDEAAVKARLLGAGCQVADEIDGSAAGLNGAGRAGEPDGAGEFDAKILGALM